jgi:hypothetical protein
VTKAQETKIAELFEEVKLLTSGQLGSLAEQLANEQGLANPDPVEGTYRLKKMAMLRIEVLSNAVERAQQTLEAHNGEPVAQHYRLKEKVEAAQATLTSYIESVTKLLAVQPEVVVRDRVRIVRGGKR